MTKTTITERVYNAIPGHAEEAALQEKLRPYRQPKTFTRTLPAAKAEVEDHIRELMSAGKDIPDNVADALVIAEQQDRSAELRAQALAAVASENTNGLGQIIQAGSAHAFAQLNKELSQVSDEIDTAAEDLTGVTTANEAINTSMKAVAAWAKLTQLATDYDEIRKVQQGLYRSVNPGVLMTDDYLAAGIFANAIDCLPYWIIRREKAFKVSSSSAGEHEYKAWLRGTVPYDEEQNLLSGIWPDAGKASHLLWASRNAQFWAPTLTQLRQALTAAATATSDNSAIPQQEAARDRYYALTGATPHTPYTNTYNQSDAQREHLEAARASAKAQARFNKELKEAGAGAEYRREQAAQRRNLEIARQL